jgi:hypothetical protein
MANGAMNVFLPVSLNAQIDASILRTGNIENTFRRIKAAPAHEIHRQISSGKAGVGGVPLNFTVGEGSYQNLRTKKAGIKTVKASFDFACGKR